jgi:hypothetical protein
MNIWQALESLPGQIALPSEWRALLGDQFTTFQTAFLNLSGDVARTFPCPTQPGALHPINIQPDGSFLAPCPVYPETCRLSLVQADLAMWQLNSARLGRALCLALGLDPKPLELLELPLFNTLQIGSWAADAVLAILTLQSDPEQFLSIVAQLVATIRQKFILLVPTTGLVTAVTQQHLASVGAALFPLATIVRFTPAGTLIPTKPPGELFARFTPQPRDIDQETAQKAYVLAKALDFEQPFKPPTPFTVFDLYFVQGLTAKQIAKDRCSKATVINRLKLICQRTGMEIDQLRRLSAYFANMETVITDPRAKHIHRHRLIHDDAPDHLDD